MAAACWLSAIPCNRSTGFGKPKLVFSCASARGESAIFFFTHLSLTNFRSQRGIVEWVNQVFAYVMPEHEDIALGATPYIPSIAVHDALNGIAVAIHPFFNDDHLAEAARVAEITTQAARDDPSATVAILVRNRSHLHEIAPKLRDAGLRFRAIDIEGLAFRPVVQDLLALTRALLHLGDRLAWVTLLRAPWCGLTLADIHALVAASAATVRMVGCRER